MRSFTQAPFLTPGDRVAVLSPSAGLPAVFPHVYELGLRRLREEFGLEPVEFATTRVMGAPAAVRAHDILESFASLGGALATIGGDDQITVLRHLPRGVLARNPTRFFGYSDNTNLLHHLFTAGVVGYHGGSVLVHLGRPCGLHPLTAASLRAALFGPSEFELTCPEEFSDEAVSWEDPTSLEREPVLRPAEPWSWHNPDRVVDGIAWGGNLEILSWLLAAGFVDSVASASVFFFETSEEMPSDVEVYRMLRNMGERGLLGSFAAVLVGRAKAWEFDRPRPVAERLAYAQAQRAAVRRALAEYNPSAVAVFDVDFGHTDPQLIIPCGGRVRVDGPARRITVWY